MARLGGLQPWLRPWADALLSWATRQGWSYRITSVRRSYRTQARLYRDYLRGRTRFPALPPGQSLHQVGRAFDVVADRRVLKALGARWRAMGGRWGGAEDVIHFEA